jgi:prepilin-type processing-associated H-X9-DG protein
MIRNSRTSEKPTLPGSGSSALMFMTNPRWPADVERYRHGVRLKSNFLFLDLHVENDGPTKREVGGDPWDVDVPNRESVTP